MGEPRAVGTSYPTANMAGGSGDALPELGNIVGLVKGGMGGVTQAMRLGEARWNGECGTRGSVCIGREEAS